MKKEEIPKAVLVAQDSEPRILPRIHEYNKFAEPFPACGLMFWSYK